MSDLIDAMGVGAGLLSSGLNFFGNKSANSQNQANFERSLAFNKWMYQDSKRFNSAPNQARLMRAAGLNPALIQGGLPVGMAQVQSAPSANPQVATNPLQGVDLTGLINSFDLNDSIQQRNTAEANRNVQEANLANANVTYRKLESRLLAIYGDKKYSAEIQESLNEALKCYQDAILASEQGQSEECRRAALRAEEFMKYATGGLSDSQRLLVERELHWFDRDMESKLRLRNQQGLALDAQAQEASQSALSTAFWNEFNRSNKNLLASRLKNEVANLYQTNRIMQEDYKKAVALANMAEYAESNKELTFWKDLIRDGLSSAVDIAGALTRYKSLGVYQSMSEAEQRQIDAKINKINYDMQPEFEQNFTKTKNGQVHYGNGKVRHHGKR